MKSCALLFLDRSQTKTTIKPWFTAGLLLGASLLLSAQEATRWDDAMSWSVANSIRDELLPEGYAYSPSALLAQYQFAQFGRFYTYAEAQLARASKNNGSGSEYGFGANLGLGYQLPIAPRLLFTALVGSGPYFITIETRRQARGFIFSDNFEAGIRYFLSKRVGIELRIRYRHISNAGLKSPNGGIDNLFLIAGLSRTF